MAAHSTSRVLLAQLDEAGARRACAFPLHDPERHPAYRIPNDRVLAWAQESAGRVVPFCRLDPGDGAIAEAERCLEAGARGIKLHPRAQSFNFDGPELDQIFALAEDARVPILIHAGRGLPPLANGLVNLALRHPDAVVILAHGAICDQAVIAARLADHPGVLYDSSCFLTLDLLELLARVPVERIVFASDPPYGRTPRGLYMTLRAAQYAGLDELAMVHGLIGATMASLLDGQGLPPTSAPRRGPSVTLRGGLARVFSYATIAQPALFTGELELAGAMIDLALAACRAPSGEPDEPAREVIARALSVARDALGREGGAGEAADLLFRSTAMACTERPRLGRLASGAALHRQSLTRPDWSGASARLGLSEGPGLGPASGSGSGPGSAPRAIALPTPHSVADPARADRLARGRPQRPHRAPPPAALQRSGGRGPRPAAQPARAGADAAGWP